MKNCLQCKHMRADYDGGYSEYTPGDGATLWCSENHWRLNNHNIEVKALRDNTELANTCADFEEEKS